MANNVIKLKDVKKDDVPTDLRVQTYFDFNAHPLEHGIIERTPYRPPG